MSSTEPPGAPDDWDPDDTGAVPLGPEPEPTGAGGAGSGGWGAAPRTEPFAVAALVWAIVSIVLPIVGTIIALVLAARAADAIRRSRGTRSGTGLVTAARVIAGVVLVLWAIGLITYFALRDGDSDSNDVTVPTRPPSTTTSLAPSTTTTTLPPLDHDDDATGHHHARRAHHVDRATPADPADHRRRPSRPPPPTEPTAPPTQPTEPPPTTTEPPPTTTEPPPTTTPIQGEERRLERLLLREGDEPNRIGPSNRGVPKEQRVVVTYTPGQTLLVTWAIDNGAPPLPEGDATCASPPPPPTTTSSTTTTTPEPDGSRRPPRRPVRRTSWPRRRSPAARRATSSTSSAPTSRTTASTSPACNSSARTRSRAGPRARPSWCSLLHERRRRRGLAVPAGVPGAARSRRAVPQPRLRLTPDGQHRTTAIAYAA